MFSTGSIIFDALLLLSININCPKDIALIATTPKPTRTAKMKLYIALLLAVSSAEAFMPPSQRQCSVSRSTMRSSYRPTTAMFMSTEATTAEEEVVVEQSEFPPLLEELREVAMKLHTRAQAPKEGEAKAPAKPATPYVPTQADYLQFLVDSNEVYKVLEEIVNKHDTLAPFQNCGIERTVELEKDIAWMCNKFDLERPEVGPAGSKYAKTLSGMVKSEEDIPEFMCHYYNYYFAHLAGGRMIGKSMSKLLLDGETLEFYKVSAIFLLVYQIEAE